MQDAYIVKALRTPGCKANKGALREVRPDDLAAAVIKAVIDQTGVDPASLDDVILGCAFPEGEQGMNVARIAGMKAGLPVSVPGVTINRFCSSGLQAIAMAVDQIKAGSADAVIAGGVESMSYVPLGGGKYSANPDLVGDWPESYASMGITAENVASKYGVDRAAMDEFAVKSHQKAAKAIAEGRFTDEIVPITFDQTHLEGNKVIHNEVTVSIDDGVRADSSVEGLGKLRPAFKMGGTTTAGNSSQTTDGAAATLIVSKAYLEKTGLKPIAKLVGFAVTGCAPEIMGIGPVQAIPAALKKAGLELSDIGLFELNEAFAAQSLAVIGELGLNPDIVNVNGGAIALGHPLGCTGAKLTATLLSQMQKDDVKYGIVTMCIGGGMGAAGVFERL